MVWREIFRCVMSLSTKQGQRKVFGKRFACVCVGGKVHVLAVKVQG